MHVWSCPSKSTEQTLWLWQGHTEVRGEKTAEGNIQLKSSTHTGKCKCFICSSKETRFSFRAYHRYPKTFLTRKKEWALTKSVCGTDYGQHICICPETPTFPHVSVKISFKCKEEFRKKHCPLQTISWMLQDSCLCSVKHMQDTGLGSYHSSCYKSCFFSLAPLQHPYRRL